MLIYLPYVLYILIAIIVYCVLDVYAEDESDKNSNLVISIFWGFCFVGLCVVLIIEFGFIRPISFILNKTLKPLIKKIVVYVDPDFKKER